MKATANQLNEVKSRLAQARVSSGLSWTELGKLADVHPSQASRICSGQFRTFSHNVVQICNALGVRLPVESSLTDAPSPDWAAAESSMRRIWDETPGGARTIAKLLDTIADLKGGAQPINRAG